MIMILGRSNSKRKYGFYANNDDSNEEEEEDRSHFLVVFVLFRYWLAGGRRRAEEFVMRHGDEIGEWRSDFGFVGCGLPRGRWLSKMQTLSYHMYLFIEIVVKYLSYLCFPSRHQRYLFLHAQG